MQPNDVFTVINIREYIGNVGESQLGEDVLNCILSEFSCERNPDVEYFLKSQAIDFTKKNQSVTYLVFSTEDAQLLGLAMNQIELLQYQAGGMVVFLEANDIDKLISFYQTSFSLLKNR